MDLEYFMKWNQRLCFFSGKNYTGSLVTGGGNNVFLRFFWKRTLVDKPIAVFIPFREAELTLLLLF
jgi:hypothetical protein